MFSEIKSIENCWCESRKSAGFEWVGHNRIFCVYGVHIFGYSRYTIGCRIMGVVVGVEEGCGFMWMFLEMKSIGNCKFGSKKSKCNATPGHFA